MVHLTQTAIFPSQVKVSSLLARGGISVVTESRRRTSMLLVSRVTANDAGEYTCAPSNAEPDSVSVHVIQGEEGAISSSVCVCACMSACEGVCYRDRKTKTGR